MLQAGKGSTAVFTRKRLSVSGALLLDFGLFVLHLLGGGWMLGFLRGWSREGKEFEALCDLRERGKKELWGFGV